MPINRPTASRPSHRMNVARSVQKHAALLDAVSDEAGLIAALPDELRPLDYEMMQVCIACRCLAACRPVRELSFTGSPLRVLAWISARPWTEQAVRIRKGQQGTRPLPTCPHTLASSVGVGCGAGLSRPIHTCAHHRGAVMRALMCRVSQRRPSCNSALPRSASGAPLPHSHRRSTSPGTRVPCRG